LTWGEIKVRVLGALDVAGVDLPAARQQRLVLSALVAVVPGGLRPDQIIEGLWLRDRPNDERKALHVLVARLRRSLVSADLEISLEGGGYRLRIDPHGIDAVVFDRLCTEERSLPEGDLADRERRLREALALWQGEPFGDLCDEPLLTEAADALRLRRDQVTGRWHDIRLELGESDTVLPELSRWADAHPLDERAWCRLAVGLHRSGRPTEALRVLRTHRQIVRDTAGLEPTSTVADLEARLLAGDPSPTTPRATPGNLTIPARSFLGRAADVQALATTIGPEAVTSLVGAAGIGKTTLALHVAAGVRHRYRDGVWICELADIGSNDSIIDVLATTLSVTQQRGQSLLDSVVAAFADAEALVVMDNCEHVRSSVRDVIGRLRRGCRKVAIVATSREPLDLADECVYQVAPLAIPGGDEPTAGNPSFELFVSRARESGAVVGSDAAATAAVVDICRRLDGLPLAIELAAARVRVMSVIEMNDRLDQRFRILTHNRSDRPARHQTLWDAVDWSYQLLDEPDRQLFDQLSVFLGGFTIEAAAAVSGRPTPDVEQSVWSLVERSLLNTVPGGDPTRYQMLETLRQFGSEQLRRRGAVPSTRDAHLRYYTEFAVVAGHGACGPDEARHVKRISSELANLRSAHQHAVAERRAHEASRLCVALHDYAEWRQFFELGTWATATLDLDVDATGCAPALHAIAGWSHCIGGNFAAAADYACRGLRAEQDGGRECGWLHDVLAHCAYFQRNDQEGLEHSHDEIDRARRSGQPHRLSYVLADSGVHAVLAGHTDLGASRTREALALAESTGNPSLVSMAQLAHGFLHREQNPIEAITWFRRALALADTVDSTWTAGMCRGELCLLLTLHGDSADALELGAAQFQKFRRAGDLSRAHSILRMAIPALQRHLDQEHWTDLVTLDAGTASRPFVNEPFSNQANAAVIETIRASLGIDAVNRAVLRATDMDDDALFELGLDAITKATTRTPTVAQ
jgi:predicted ATPase/DNA-binding SARP family transcriptional activator